MPGIDSRSAGIEKGQVEAPTEIRGSPRSAASKSAATASGLPLRADCHRTDLFQPPKPGRLPLGELPRACLNPLDRLAERRLHRPAWRSLRGSRSPARPRRTAVRAPACRARTSSTNPASKNCTTRRLMRSCRLARGSSRAKTGTPGGAGRSCSAWSSLIGRPVSSSTSRARTTLRRSWG